MRDSAKDREQATATGTEPVRAESRATSSSELNRIASSLARFGGWSVDLAEGRVHWSDEVAEIHEMPPGYSPSLEEGIGFYAPEWRAKITEVFTACARDGTPYDEELQIVTARGRRVWVRSIGSAIRDAGGSIVGVQGAFQDISERKHAQLKLAESELRYRALFENMTAGFVLFQLVEDDLGNPRDLVIVDANRGFETTTGLNVADVRGRRLTEVLPGVERDAVDWIGIYGRVAQTGEAAQFEQRSDLLGVDYIVAAYRSGPRLCAVTFLDVTERRRAEDAVRGLHEQLKQHAAQLEQRVLERTAELEAAKTRAEAADKAKSTFLATMSHELRTPLNSIIGFTDVLLAGAPGPLTPEQHKQFGIVRQASQHLLALITDVLDIARIEAGQLRLSFEPIDLRQVLLGVCRVFEPEARRRGLEFVVQPGAGPAPVFADRRRVEQVLHNLIGNALKFTQQGSVAVSLERDGGRFAVSVADTGIGIRADDLARLFRPFNQIEPDRPAHAEGTGLGLAISKHLAEAMQGDITVASEPGVGSRFTLRIPVHASG